MPQQPLAACATRLSARSGGKYSEGVHPASVTSPRLLSDPLLRLIPLSVVASLYLFSVYGGIINGSPLADVAAGYGLAYFAALWAEADAAASHHWPAYHYGLFLWFFGVLFIPHYVLKTRGTRGVPLAVLLAAVLWLPVAAGMLGWWLYEDLPDFR